MNGNHDVFTVVPSVHNGGRVCLLSLKYPLMDDPPLPEWDWMGNGGRVSMRRV